MMQQALVPIPNFDFYDYTTKNFPYVFYIPDDAPLVPALEWCEDQFGPEAIQYERDEKDRIISGTGVDHLDRPWATCIGNIHFRTKEHATLFKMVWR